MEYFYLLAGFIILLTSGHFLVKASVDLAKYFGVSTLVIGVTVVSMGTSAPELIVSLKAALSNHPEISLGNVIGSNISNIALVLAITAIVYPISVQRTTIIIDWPVMMLSGILFYIFILNGYLNTYEGIIMVGALGIYVYASIRKSHKEEKLNHNQKKPNSPLYTSILLILLSSAGLLIGSTWLINGATQIATHFGVSERIISLTLIAFGTSVPELATSLIAAVKKETDISVGNIIGSNIFNVFGILGITSIVKEIPVNIASFSTDIYWMLFISVVLFILILSPKRGLLKHYKGFILFILYVLYLYYIL